MLIGSVIGLQTMKYKSGRITGPYSLLRIFTPEHVDVIVFINDAVDNKPSFSRLAMQRWRSVRAGRQMAECLWERCTCYVATVLRGSLFSRESWQPAGRRWRDSLPSRNLAEACLTRPSRGVRSTARTTECSSVSRHWRDVDADRTIARGSRRAGAVNFARVSGSRMAHSYVACTFP